jgi:hypothetical protein
LPRVARYDSLASVRVVLACLAVLLCGVHSRAASASEAKPSQAAQLSYLRGPGAQLCPEEAFLREAVAAELGYDPFAENARRKVSATIEREGSRLRAHVEIHDAQGRPQGARDLTTETLDCNELVSSIALAVSIAIDPRAAAQSRPPAPARPTTPWTAPAAPVAEPPPGPSAPAPLPGLAVPPVAAPVPGPSSVPPPARSAPVLSSAAPVATPLLSSAAPVATPVLLDSPARTAPVSPDLGPAAPPSRWALRTSLGGVASYGSEPGVGLGGTLQLGMRRGPLTLAVEGRGEIGGSASAGAHGLVRAYLLGGGPVACLQRGVALACAVGIFGALEGSSSGVTESRQQSTFYAAAGGRLGLEFPWSDAFAVGVHADLLAVLVRTTLTVGGTEVWTTSAITADLSVAATASFE